MVGIVGSGESMKVPKGSINLSAERGIIFLRGEVPNARMRNRLAREAEQIEGVWGVQNLLHLPGEAIGEELAFGPMRLTAGDRLSVAAPSISIVGLPDVSRL